MIAAIRGIFKGSEPTQSGKNYMVVRQAASYEHKGRREQIYVHNIMNGGSRANYEHYYGYYLEEFQHMKRAVDEALDDYLSRSTIEERNVIIVIRDMYMGRFIIQRNKNPATIIFYVRPQESGP